MGFVEVVFALVALIALGIALLVRTVKGIG